MCAFWARSLALLYARVNISAGLLQCEFIYDDPSDLFEVQTAGTHTQAVVGRACDMVYAAGSTVTNGRSKEELAGSAGANDMFTVLRLTEDPSNSDVSNANSNWIVRFNVGKHVYLTGI